MRRYQDVPMYGHKVCPLVQREEHASVLDHGFRWGQMENGIGIFFGFPNLAIGSERFPLEVRKGSGNLSSM